MKRAKNVVAKILKGLNPKMFVVHCFEHVLDLSVSDFFNKVDSMKNTS